VKKVKRLLMTNSNGKRRLKSLLREHSRTSVRGSAVYHTLRTAILRNILREGERLQERPIGEILGVSRTPIREALQRLEAEGFVANHPRLGFVVETLTLQDIEDIYVMRVALEGVAARLAARVATAGDVETLEAIQERIEKAHERRDIDRVTILNSHFHDELCRAAKNKRLADAANRLHDNIQRLGRTTLVNEKRRAQALREHRGLIAAIKAGDPERAERIAADHMRHAKEVRVSVHAHGRERTDLASHI
jgi:DNA-binding GntR family transcriptional regulator